MQPTSFSAKTKLKTNPISANSFSCMDDRIYIAQSKGIHIYSPSKQDFVNSPQLSENLAGTVTCLTKSDELIFFCSGTKILALASNLKIIFEFDTYLAIERVNAIHVAGYNLWLVSDNMVNHFMLGGSQLSNKHSRRASPSPKTEDLESHIFDVGINHSLLWESDEGKPALLLFKGNSTIELYEKKDKESDARFTLSSPPTYAIYFPKNTQKILVGTASGELTYLEFKRKKFKQIWTITENSKGKVNCLQELGTGFLVFRDRSIEFWNANSELINSEPTKSRIVSCIYRQEDDLLLLGSDNGQITEMLSYEKLIKEKGKKNQTAEKESLLEAIKVLEKEKNELKRKLESSGKVKVTQVTVRHTVSLDYNHLCYVLELVSDHPIVKVNLHGDIQLIHQQIFFSAKQGNIITYVVRVDSQRTVQLRFHSEERFHEDNQVNCTVFLNNNGVDQAVPVKFQIRHCSLYRRIDNTAFKGSPQHLHTLSIGGQFKKHQVIFWLGKVFGDLANLEETSNCFESLITKAKTRISCSGETFTIQSESPTPVYITKKALLHESNKKSQSLDFNGLANKEAIFDLLRSLKPRTKELERCKKEFELLPGLLEIRNEITSEDLIKVMENQETIRQKYHESLREYQELQNAVCLLYDNYRKLAALKINEFMPTQMKSMVKNYDEKIIYKAIVD